MHLTTNELKELQKILKELQRLNAKVENLTQVVAISSQIEKILEEKTKTEQIEVLSVSGFSRNAIALVVGTTPETVSVRISEMKKKQTGDSA